MGGTLWLLLLASALASAACATRAEAPLSPGAAAHPGWAPATMRVALTLPMESGDGATALDRLRNDEADMPDIAGRWTGVWSGFGVMSNQAGRWGWGTIVLSDTLAADVPPVVTYRGALGVPVMFDVFPTRVVMKHEAGGAYLSAVFRVDGDRMLGTLRGHDTLIVLSRDR